VRGIPISYAIDGHQYVVIAAGFTLFVFAFSALASFPTSRITAERV